MKFRYFKFPLPERSHFFGTSILKPVIPIGISVQGVSLQYAALIDSGADFCIFDAEIGEALGLDVRGGTRTPFGGIQEAHPTEAFLHEITLTIGGWHHLTTVGFSYGIAQHGYGILGQKGFFDIFIVKFDILKEEIELKEHRNN